MEQIPFIWVLHIGIFVVWVPMVFGLRNQELKNFQRSPISTGMSPFPFLKMVLKSTPRWLILLAGVGFFYAIINFLLFLMSRPGVPDVRNGQYVLENHGKLIKT
jgi:hypothetical protein